MTSRRAVLALVLIQMIAVAALAQQAAEFGRATGGEVVLTPKGSAPFSGSLELSFARGNAVFGRGSSPAYGATAGGTLMQDRLWFFASASRQKTPIASFANRELLVNAASSAIGARVHGQVGASQDFSAFFESARRPELTTIGTASAFGGSVPSSFLSLHYTGIVSGNMFFTGSVTRSKQ